jgi:uncharacterized protein YaiL (DUF2058 family)
MQNLRDKLLKAGLVTEEQTKQSEPKGRAAAKAPDHNGYQVPVVRAPPPTQAVPKLPPLPGIRAHQQNESAKQQELAKELRELVLAEQVALEAGPQAFYFQTRKGKLRRLELSLEQAQALERGELAVVERQDPALIEHALVPASIAEHMFARFPKSVRFFNRPGSPIGFAPETEAE